jgi:hypothetical protein
VAIFCTDEFNSGSGRFIRSRYSCDHYDLDHIDSVGITHRPDELKVVGERGSRDSGLPVTNLS